MTELTENQYEDAAQFLNNYINTLQSFAKTMITTLEIFKKRKVKREFLTSFHKIQYCIAKLQVIQKYSEANLKDYYRTFEDAFSEWRKMYSETIPDNYVYDSYELLEPHCNSQYSYDPEILNNHNLMDSGSMESDILDKAVSHSPHNESNSAASFIVEVNSTENTQDESNEKLRETSLYEYASLMDSESNEIDTALLKLNDIHNKSIENDDLLDENNILPIELQTENNIKVPSPNNLESLDSINRIINSEGALNGEEINSETLSQVSNLNKALNGEEIKTEIMSQTTNLKKTLNDEIIKSETLPQLSNLVQILNVKEIETETLSQESNLENVSNDQEMKSKTSYQVSNLNKTTNHKENSPETSSLITNSDKNIESFPFGNNPQNNKNLFNNNLSKIKDKVFNQNCISVEDKLIENSEDSFILSESGKTSVENIDRIHSPNNNKPSGNDKSTNNILIDLGENSSSMDEEKMARIEAQILNTDTDSIFDKNTELLDTSYLSDDLEETDQNSKNYDTNSEQDLEDIDELLSDIDVSDEELKVKYKQAIKNICDDSASIESSDSEQSYNSIDEFENEALQSLSHGKIVQLNILDEKSNASSLNLDNVTNIFQKDCTVKLQRMDFSQIAANNPSCSSNNTEDENRLLNTSLLKRKRGRISSSSSSESTMRSKKKHKSLRKRKTSSSSSSSSGSDSSSNYSNSSINSDDSDENNQLTDEILSDWVPEISDISSISGKSSSESSSDSSDQEDKIEKRRKSDETKKIQDKNKVKDEEESEASRKADSESASVNDWRNDPLLRFNLNDKKTKQKCIRNSGSSDVEIIENNMTDDDVITTKYTNENNGQNAVNKKKHKDLKEMINRKKSVTVSISSDSDSSDESENEAEGDKTKTRKRTKKVMSYKELAEATKKANEEEKERMIRLTQRNSMSFQLSNGQENSTEPTLILEYNVETKKPRIEVHPELLKILKDHQKEGVKFMWDSCYESIDLISQSGGSGCVLAHCMGLGKTLQIVTLLYTLFSYRETTIKRALILAPITTIKNWEREFNRWLMKLKKVFTVDSVIGKLTPEVRFRKIKTWLQNGGVFIMSYSLFRSLTTNKTDKGEVDGSRNKENKIKEFCHKALLNPGPDLLICDEGHTLKNSKSTISQCISGIRTGRRIMLTGTPMQNNLKEYYCMINLVKPNLLGSAKEFANRFENPITKGQTKDSSPYEIRMMKRRAHVLHKKLSGVVQRVEGSILKPYLPSLLHYIVFIKMSNEQVTIYKKFIEIVKKIHSLRLLSTYQRAKRISTHPLCLYTRISRTNPNIQTSSINNIDSSQLEEDKIDDDLKDSTWYTSIYDKTKLERVECGTKLMIFFHILNQCELRGDKLLAFSTSVNILNVVEKFLQNAPIQDYINSKWENGVDYVRVDGSTSTELRDQIYENFNDKNNQQLRLLIATTKVTGLGLNLLGANRIVILDTSWNPSDDMQSVYRIYRFGQSKDCYVYSLVSLGAMEEKIYERCVTKQAISCRVVDQQQVDRHYTSKGNVIKEFFTFVDYNQVERPAPNVPSDRVLATALHKYPDYIFSYHEHDKLLQNHEDEELDESEREAAWQEFEMEEERLKVYNPLRNNQYAPNQSMPLFSNQQNPMNFSNQSGTSVELQNNIHLSHPLPNYLNPMYYSTQSHIQNNLLSTSNNVLRNIHNHQNIPSTSKASDLNEPEYILSDPIDINRLEPNKNDGNPFVNENRLQIGSNLNELQTTTLETNRDIVPNSEMPDPDIEMDVVVIEE